MTFGEAVSTLLAGHAVTKSDWNDQETFLHLVDGLLKIHRSDEGKDFNLIVSKEDLEGTDWVLRPSLFS